MKTLEQQIAEMQDRLNKLENNLTERSEEFEECCIAECECGCDEPETETNEDKVILIRGEVLDAPEPEERKFTFTKNELISLSTMLVQNTLESVKESVENTDISNDDHVSLELSWNNTIEIELDGERIKKDIVDEIEHHISFNHDDVFMEIVNILSEMGIEEK